MCCGIDKKKGLNPSQLAAIRKKEGRASKYSAKKKTLSNNGKK